MAAVNPTAQNQIRGSNPDSTTQSFGEPTTECLPISPVYSSDPEDIYILDPEDEKDNIPCPRLELIDEQFNLKMKEIFSQASSGQQCLPLLKPHYKKLLVVCYNTRQNPIH